MPLTMPGFHQSDKTWHEAILKLSLEEKILVKKKLEFALNDVYAQQRSISLEEKRNKEFKSDRFRRDNDLRNKNPKEINNVFVRAHIQKLKNETLQAKIFKKFWENPK